MNSNTKLKQAEKQVKRIRNFYNHLQVFIIAVILIILFSDTIISFFENHIHNGGTINWIKANIWVNVLIWFLVIVFQGFFAFKYKISFLENWEQKKVKEYMNQNE